MCCVRSVVAARALGVAVDQWSCFLSQILLLQAIENNHY
jgi:hypothetical protein